MQLKSKEHYDLLLHFEKDFKEVRLDKEPKELWEHGTIYEDGMVNKLFDAYRKGYSLGRWV